jgi:hypothetical protein
MDEILGDRIHSCTAINAEMPSPNELKGKILVKASRAK